MDQSINNAISALEDIIKKYQAMPEYKSNPQFKQEVDKYIAQIQQNTQQMKESLVIPHDEMICRLFETADDDTVKYMAEHLSERALFGSMQTQVKKLSQQVKELSQCIEDCGKITQNNVKNGKTDNSTQQAIADSSEALNQLKKANENLLKYLERPYVQQAIVDIDNNTTLFGKSKDTTKEGFVTSTDYNNKLKSQKSQAKNEEQLNESVLYESILNEGFGDKLKGLGDKFKQASQNIAQGVKDKANSVKDEIYSYTANNNEKFKDKDLKKKSRKNAKRVITELSKQVTAWQSIADKCAPVFSKTGNSKFERVARSLGKTLTTAGGFIRAVGAVPGLQAVGAVGAGIAAAGALATAAGNTRRDAAQGKKGKAVLDVLAGVGGAAMGAGRVASGLGKAAGVLKKVGAVGQTIVGSTNMTKGASAAITGKDADGKELSGAKRLIQGVSALGGAMMAASGLQQLGVKFPAIALPDTKNDEKVIEQSAEEALGEVQEELPQATEAAGATEAAVAQAENAPTFVENSNQAVAGAKAGDWIQRSNGEKYQLTKGDITWAKAKIGEIPKDSLPKVDLNNPQPLQVTQAGTILDDNDVQQIQQAVQNQNVDVNQVVAQIDKEPESELFDTIINDDQQVEQTVAAVEQTTGTDIPETSTPQQDLATATPEAPNTQNLTPEPKTGSVNSDGSVNITRSEAKKLFMNRVTRTFGNKFKGPDGTIYNIVDDPNIGNDLANGLQPNDMDEFNNYDPDFARAFNEHLSKAPTVNGIPIYKEFQGRLIPQVELEGNDFIITDSETGQSANYSDVLRQMANSGQLNKNNVSQYKDAVNALINVEHQKNEFSTAGNPFQNDKQFLKYLKSLGIKKLS